MAEKLVLEFIGKDEISKTTQGITKSLGGLGMVAAGAATAGLAVAAGAVVGLGAALVSSIGDAMAAQEVQAQLAAVLESTGGVAGVTADMANELASSFQAVTRFEDDAILSGENMLLTFTNIGADVFPMATQTMLDMSQALGQDLNTSAIQLGKALNDPVQGISALQRVGVTFTEEQKNVIASLVETGDVAGAQTIILQELQREFGGSAVAAGQTFAGQMDRLKNTFGDVKETIGGAFLPILQQLAELLLTGLNSPQFQALLAGLSAFLTGVLVPAISTLITWFRDQVMPRFAEAGRQIREVLQPAFQQLKAAFDQIINALGISAGETDVLGAALGVLDVVLKVIVVGAKAFATIMQGIAAAIKLVAVAVRFVIDKFNEMKAAIQSVAASMPPWLIPGSPTEFEIGLRGIARAAGDVGAGLGMGAGLGGGPGMAAAGMGGTVIVNLTYAPAISLADRYEAETKLMPFIQAALRRG